MGDQPVENIVQNIQPVTSVGSSWIICRSKSHAGRIYYFNTLTGEAAWNLSDPEIEKAKKRTSILKNQSGVTFESCPEPKEPPMDVHYGYTKGKSKNEVNYSPARVYNKQIINNQFSKQTFAPFGNLCTNCNTHSAPMSIDAFNMPVPHNCASNVWAVEPRHQIVIASSASNVEYNNTTHNIPIQNTAVPLSKRFNLIQPINRTDAWRGDTSYFKKSNHNANTIDLRQKLSARRKFVWDKPPENIHYQDEDSIGNNNKSLIQIIRPVIKDITSSETDDNWLQEHTTLHGSQLVLDVTPLKKMVTSDGRFSWYVVADTYVLLNHMSLINVLVNSDDQCQLMVPDYIMAELQNRSRQLDSLLMSRAHHVLHVLSKLFAAGCALIGKDPITKLNDLQIFDFCYKLLEQNLDVVLLSNNIRLEQYKNNSNITILKIPELKDLLSSGDVSYPRRQILYPLDAIKITVPGNVSPNETNKFKDTQSDDKRAYDTNSPKITESQNVQKEINKDWNVGALVTNKVITNDVGVQTEFTSMHLYGIEKVDKGTITESDLIGFNNDNETVKQRGIQLKRTLSHHSSTDNVERKQFKWRRRKRIEYTPNNTISDDKPELCKQTIQEDTLNCNQNFNRPINFENNEVSNIQGSSTCYYENIDSSETDSSCTVQKNIPDKVIIEETSTSGIISNSASNVDSDIMHSVKPNEGLYNQNVNEERDKCKCAMFEVESTAMEEYLKMKCDEWVSRFVQIMEEVLTQVLQQESPFFNFSLPPPWSIHEATECIKKKFNNDNDVIDAANRLTGLLYKICDRRGKIKPELKPSEFMEMYSYGVYLVDSLQSLLNSCDDLQTAADSLSKLLSDIVDHNQDTVHGDSFMETSNVSNANGTQLGIDDVMIEENDKPREEVTQTIKSSPMGKKYNLRSTQKNVFEDVGECDTPVKFIRKIDIESNFFSSLKLQKNDTLSDDVGKLALLTTKEMGIAKPEDCNNANQNKPKNGPQIIRNFTKCLEYEEKLKSKRDNNLDRHGNSENLEKNEIVEVYDYYDEDYNLGCDYRGFESDDFNSYHEMETGPENYEVEFQSEHKNVEVKGNIYRQVAGKLINELQDAFLEVHSFCEKTRDELSGAPIVSQARKLEICEKAEKSRLHIEVLRKTLNSIVFREDTNCGNNLQSALKEAGFHLDVAMSSEYRNMISKYSYQANILLEAVNFVIQAVR